MEKTSKTDGVVPKPASSIMLIRDTMDGLEVLMMKRAQTMAFAPGAFVFPGGKVDASDGDAGRWRRRINGRMTDDMGFRIAALRELYEEVGVLLMNPYQQFTPRNMADFYGLVRRRPGELDVKSMVPFAQWITPEGLPRRYDTYFYLAPVRGAVQAVADGSEAVSARWVSPHRLLEAWEAGKAPLMFPTRLNLMKLARAHSVQEAMTQARETPPVCVLPRITQNGQRREVTIPAEAGFGVTAATPRELMVEGGSRG